MQVVRQRRGCDPDLLLEATNRQPPVPRPHQRAINFKARRVAERFELLRRFFDFPRNRLSRDPSSVKTYFHDPRNSLPSIPATVIGIGFRSRLRANCGGLIGRRTEPEVVSPFSY